MQFFCNKMYFITEEKNLPSDGENTVGGFWLTVPICDFIFPQQEAKL